MDRDSSGTDEQDPDLFIVYIKSGPEDLKDAPNNFKGYNLVAKRADGEDEGDSFEIKEGEPVMLQKSPQNDEFDDESEENNLYFPTTNQNNGGTVPHGDDSSPNIGNSQPSFSPGGNKGIRGGLRDKVRGRSNTLNPSEVEDQMISPTRMPQLVEGLVTKPLKSERCDFIIVDATGIRHRIFIEKRQKPETVKK